jgi:muramoyltetrapeptide carboxypeptidase
MNRRLAIKSLVAATLAGSISSAPAESATGTVATTILKPRRLSQGDTVGLIAPASNENEDEDIRIAADIVESLGFRVRLGEHIFTRNLYLAGTDQQRADDVNNMFAQDDVDAIFCVRGGYGTPRILPFLDYDLIADNPKILMGFSDITGLLTAIHSKTGMVGFHGSVLRHNFSEYTLSEFKKVVMHPMSRTSIGAAPPFETGVGRVNAANRMTRIAGGTARGPLLGGNLSLICSLMGTEFEPDFRGRILFLEDVDEAPYRIDRLLTQLWLANKLSEVAGIAFGKFTKTETSGNSFSIEEVLRDRCSDLGIPVIRGFMIGHVADRTVVPIGIEAELNADDATLTLLDTAVV